MGRVCEQDRGGLAGDGGRTVLVLLGRSCKYSENLLRHGGRPRLRSGEENHWQGCWMLPAVGCVVLNVRAVRTGWMEDEDDQH